MKSMGKGIVSWKIPPRALKSVWGMLAFGHQRVVKRHQRVSDKGALKSFRAERGSPISGHQRSLPSVPPKPWHFSQVIDKL